MEQINLSANFREKSGKEFARRLRKEAKVPAVVYKGGKSLPLWVLAEDLLKALHTSAGENVLINLEVKKDAGKQERTVIIKEVQYHPIKGYIMHVDFNEISLTKKLKVKVPLVTKGEAIGVKQENGILEHVIWELEIQCLPTDIPEKIEVAVSSMKIGDSIFVRDLIIPQNIEVLTDPELIVVNCSAPKVEVPAEEKPAEEVMEEPEVIKQKKPEEIGEDQAKEAPKKAPEKEKE